MPIKIDIISGFLGAGKTTLIKKLVENKLPSGKIVIVENEFGDVGIDGRLLKETGISVREINSGCICCTLSGDFQAALNDVIKKYHPDRVIIEPSGVGKLSEIKDSCRRIVLRQNCEFGICVTMVDATKYTMYEKNFAEFFLDQIKNAKTIILSRTEKVSIEKLESIVKNIRKHNSDATIVTTPLKQLSADKVLSVAERKIPKLMEKAAHYSERSPQEHSHCGDSDNHDHHDHTHHHADDVFEVWSIETPKIFRACGIDEALQRITQYGVVLRAKGIVPVENERWIQFNYVPGEVSLEETVSDYTGRLCVIGQNLDRFGLTSLFGVS